MFPGAVGQDVYAWVPWHCAKVHVARYGGGRVWLAQGRGARGGAGRVAVFTLGGADAVWGDVYGEGSESALYLMGLDVVEAPHRPCVGVSLADTHRVCPRLRQAQAVRDDACDRAVVGGI